MRDIINFIIDGFNKIVKILNIQFFEDFPITFLQLILASVVITLLIKLVNGIGGENSINGGLFTYGKNIGEIKNRISNNDRKKQIVKGDNKWAKNIYI